MIPARMSRGLSAIALTCACAEAPGIVAERGVAPSPIAACAPGPWSQSHREVIARGLDTPWGMATASDGRILITERKGTVRVIDGNGLVEQPWASLPVAHIGESGLLGIALAPDFSTSNAAYVAGVYAKTGIHRGVATRAARRVMRAVRLSVGTDYELRVHRVVAGQAPVLIATGIPAAPLHPGGALLHESSGSMLLSVGDSRDPWKAQRESDPRGKFLRLSNLESGSVARFGEGAELVASGTRNVQGIGVLPGDSALVFIDHGPTGQSDEAYRMGRDELNILSEGANFGWPAESGIHTDARFVSPILEWTEAIAPGGLVVISRDGDTNAADVFVTGLRGQTLRRVELRRAGGGRWQVACEETVLGTEYGRLRAVARHPNGGILVATSNRDSRGAPKPDDDVVLWLQPMSRQ